MLAEHLKKDHYHRAFFEQLIASIIEQICQKGDDEITSREIGHLILNALKKEDHVAYIRFASTKALAISSHSDPHRRYTRRKTQ